MDALIFQKKPAPMIKTRDTQSLSGFTLIEVLITIVVVAIGLLGLAGLQVTSLNNQLESYQRAQALLLLEDMSNRIRVNAVAAKAGAYTDGDQYGLLTEEDCSAEATTAERDLCDWNIALAGTGVMLDTEVVGSVLGARGCIDDITTTAGSSDGETVIRLTIAWQGMAKTAAPSSVCGLNQYGEDTYRRTASIDTVLANLAL
jgi:type IV pilus assembly protein PilV